MCSKVLKTIKIFFNILFTELNGVFPIFISTKHYYSALNLLKAGEEFLKRKTLGKDLSEYKAFRLKDYRTQCDNQMSELELQLM